MRTFKIIFCLVLIVILPTNIFCQVGIGNTNPDASSILDITSTTQGVLTPRMTTTQRDAISSPAEGLLVFDTDEEAFYYYDTSSWVKLLGSVKRDNYKLVKTIADLADELTAGGGTKYLLDTNYLYEINGKILVDFPIDLDGAQIMGLDIDEDILERTGAGDLICGSKGGGIRELSLSSPSGAVFNLDDTAGTEELKIHNVNIYDSASVGTVEGYYLVDFESIEYYGNTTGVIFEDIHDLLLNNQEWLPTNSGTYETYQGTFQLIEKEEGFCDVDTGNIGIDVSNVPLVVEKAVILGTIFDGDGLYVNRYSTAPANFDFTSVWFVDSPGLTVETDFVASGYYHMVDNTTATTLTGDDIPAKISGTTTADNLFRTESTVSNRLTYIGHKFREFEVVCTGTLEHITNNARIYELSLYKNGIQIPQISSERRFTKNDVGNFTLVGMLPLNPDDYIEVYISINNNNNVGSCIISRLSVILK
ncbi:MAG: hypothetical protein ABJL44_12305 [Algibacter sp.]